MPIDVSAKPENIDRFQTCFAELQSDFTTWRIFLIMPITRLTGSGFYIELSHESPCLNNLCIAKFRLGRLQQPPDIALAVMEKYARTLRKFHNCSERKTLAGVPDRIAAPLRAYSCPKPGEGHRSSIRCNEVLWPVRNRFCE